MPHYFIFQSRMKYAAILCCALLILCGCSKTKQIDAYEARPSGFLQDYSQLVRGGEDQAQLVYINTGARFAEYKKIVIEPVTVWQNPNSGFSKVDKEELQRLADYLHTAIVDELKDDYEIVTEPGHATLRLRAAITEARESNPRGDIVSTILPPALIADASSRALTGAFRFVGRARVEVEILDSEYNIRLLAAVDERVGKPLRGGKFDTWGDVKSTYDYWAEKLAKRLAELRNPEPAQ